MALRPRFVRAWVLGAAFGVPGFGKAPEFQHAVPEYANEAVLPFYILHQTVLLRGLLCHAMAIPDFSSG